MRPRAGDDDNYHEIVVFHVEHLNLEVRYFYSVLASLAGGFSDQDVGGVGDFVGAGNTRENFGVHYAYYMCREEICN